MDHQSIEVFDRTGRVASFDARKGSGFMEAAGARGGAGLAVGEGGVGGGPRPA
jgi:hypothetical protein